MPQSPSDFMATRRKAPTPDIGETEFSEPAQSESPSAFMERLAKSRAPQTSSPRQQESDNRSLVAVGHRSESPTTPPRPVTQQKRNQTTPASIRQNRPTATTQTDVFGRPTLGAQIETELADPNAGKVSPRIEAADRFREGLPPVFFPRIASAGGRFRRAAAEAIPRTVEGLAEGFETLGTIGGDPVASQPTGVARAVKTVTRPVIEQIERVNPVDPNDQSFLTNKLPSALGSAAGMMATGALGRVARIPAILTSAGVGAGVESSQVAEEADAAGISPEKRNAAIAMAGATGLTEALGIGRALDKFGLKQAFTRRAFQVLEEGGQEALQSYLGNINAALVGQYDPNRPLSQGVLESAVLGGIVGGTVQGASGLAARGQRGPAPQQPAPTAGLPDTTLERAIQNKRGAIPPTPQIATPREPLRRTGFDAMSPGQRRRAMQSGIGVEQGALPSAPGELAQRPRRGGPQIPPATEPVQPQADPTQQVIQDYIAQVEQINQIADPAEKATALRQAREEYRAKRAQVQQNIILSEPVTGRAQNPANPVSSQQDVVVPAPRRPTETAVTPDQQDIAVSESGPTVRPQDIVSSTPDVDQDTFDSDRDFLEEDQGDAEVREPMLQRLTASPLFADYVSQFNELPPKVRDEILRKTPPDLRQAIGQFKPNSPAVASEPQNQPQKVTTPLQTPVEIPRGKVENVVSGEAVRGESVSRNVSRDMREDPIERAKRVYDESNASAERMRASGNEDAALLIERQAQKDYEAGLRYARAGKSKAQESVKPAVVEGQVIPPVQSPKVATIPKLPEAPQPPPAAKTRIADIQRPGMTPDDPRVQREIERVTNLSPEELDNYIQRTESQLPQMTDLRRSLSETVLKEANRKRAEYRTAGRLGTKYEDRPTKGEGLGKGNIQEMQDMAPEQRAEYMAGEESRRKTETEARRRQRDAKAAAKTVTHPDEAINGQPIIARTQDGRVIVPNEANKSGVSVVKDRAEAVEIPETPQRAVKPAKSLAQFVKESGGIKPSQANAGELRYASTKESGKVAVLNRRGVSADEMRRQAIEAGYGDWDTESEFLSALRDDVSGRKVESVNRDIDHEAEYKKSLTPDEQAETVAFDNFLGDKDAAAAYDRVTGGDLSGQAITELERHITKHGLSEDVLDTIVGEGRAARQRQGQAQPLLRPDAEAQTGKTSQEQLRERAILTSRRSWRSVKPAERAPKTFEDAQGFVGDVRSEYRQRSGEREGTLYLNQQGTAVLSSAAKQAGVKSLAGGFEGVNMDLGSLQKAGDLLRSKADHYGESGKTLTALADQIDTAIADARAQGYTAIPVVDVASSPGARIKKVVREEDYHGWQRRAGLLSDERGGQVVERFKNDPTYRHLRKELLKDGYPEDEITLNVEAAAKLASGQARDYGLDVDTANDYLHSYYNYLAETFGPEVLEQNIRTAPSARRSLEDVRELRGIQRSAGAAPGGSQGQAAAVAGRRREGAADTSGVARGLQSRGAERSKTQDVPPGQTERASAKTRAEVENAPEFKKFFGNSKVVDKEGKPMVVYHSTTADFDTFDRTADLGFHFGTPEAANSRSGRFRGEHPEGSRVLPAYLSIKNPLETGDIFAFADPLSIASNLQRQGVLPRRMPEIEKLDAQSSRKEITREEANRRARDVIVSELERQGYDGIKYRNSAEDGGSISWVAFKPQQIKSATGNKGTFNPEDRSILASVPRKPQQRDLIAGLRRKGQPKDSSIPEKISTVRKAGFLGGIPTHAKNVLSNAIFQVSEAGARGPAALVDIGLSAATGRRSVPGWGAADVGAGLRGAKQGLKEAKDIIKSGQRIEDIRRSQRDESQFKNKYVKGYAEFIFRSLSAEDAIFRNIAQQRALEGLAKVQAINEARAKQIPRSQIRARQQELIDKPTPALTMQAIADAEVAVFQNKNRLSEAVAAGRKELSPGGKLAMDLFLPYDKTPTNIVLRMLDYSPAGLIRAGLQTGNAAGRGFRAARDRKAAIKGGSLADPGFKERVKLAIKDAIPQSEQKKFAETIGRSLTGTGAFLATGAWLASKGLLTGFYGDKDEEKRNQELGKQPGSLLIGGRSYKIADFGPPGMLLVLGATMAREGTKPLKDESKRGMNVYRATGKAIAESIPLFEAGKQASDVLTGEGNVPAKLGRLAAGFIPRVGNLSKVFDPYEREAGTFGSEIVKEIPLARNFLPRKQTVAGEDVEPGFVERGIGFIDPASSRPLKENAALEELEAAGMGVGTSKRKEGESDEAFKARSRDTQKMFQDAAGKVRQSDKWMSLTGTQKRKVLESLKARASRQVQLDEIERDSFALDPDTVIDAVLRSEEKKAEKERMRGLLVRP